MGCQMWGGTFCGPVDTTLEAEKPISDIDAVTPPTPTATMRSLIIEKGPTAPPPANLMILIDPVMFRISSRPQLPASRSAPSTQFRKRARLFENSIGLNGFSAGLRPFRAWVLGQGQEAGGYNAPGLPELTGEYVSQAGCGAIFNGGLSGVFAKGTQLSGPVPAYASGSYTTWRLKFLASGANRLYGASPTVMPPSVDIPVILYLGRPR